MEDENALAQIGQAGGHITPADGMIGGYRLLSTIGRGGMSVVYLGQSVDDPSLLVAIKVFSQAAFPGEDGVAEEARARFRREAQTAAQLDHPHILRPLDYTEAAEYSVIISPYVAGGSLTAYLATSGQLPLDECARMIAQIASALDYAHQRGVIHRDIKSGNILRDEQGNLLLTDFGIARLYDSGPLALTAAQQPDRSLLTQTGVMIGTPAYMARADSWSACQPCYRHLRPGRAGLSTGDGPPAVYRRLNRRGVGEGFARDAGGTVHTLSRSLGGGQ